MKTITITIRILYGSLLISGSVAYLLRLFPQEEFTDNMKTFNEGIDASIYIMPLVKFIELICGISFIVNRFIPLATIIIFPITINILCVQIFLVPAGLPVAIFILLSNLFLAFRCREIYKNLFVVKFFPNTIKLKQNGTTSTN